MLTSLVIWQVKRGEARYHGSGFKGKGYTFDETERNEAQRATDLQKRQYEIDQGIFVEVRLSVLVNAYTKNITGCLTYSC